MKTLTIFTTLLLLMSHANGAVVLALYDAQGSEGNGDFNTNAFDSVDTELTTDAVRLAQGGGLTGGGAASFILDNTVFNPSDSGKPGFNLADVTSLDRATAITNGDFFSFDLVSNGQTVTYEQLSFFTNQFGTSSRLDVSYNYTSTSETFLLTGFTPVENNASVQLETINFADFTTTETVTWTFYMYGATDHRYGTRFDDITLTATVIPEPSSIAMMGLMGVALLLNRRLFKK